MGGNIARMGEVMNMKKKDWMETMKVKYHLEDLGENWRIMLECVLGK